MRRHLRLLAPFLPLLAGAAHADDSFIPSTGISIIRGSWALNGKTTYPGTLAEGLLLNARMVNAVFEDRNPSTCPPDFDPDENTRAFISRIPDYVRHGLRAFTVGLQGGSPGYRGSLNSAYQPDGSLRPEYLRRVGRVIEACDAAGAVVILSCFDHEQDQILEDARAVRRAAAGAAAWIRKQGYTNILLEIANEHPHQAYDHPQIREPEGMRELIRLVKEAMPSLLVSSSGLGGGRLQHPVAVAADFLLLHFNNVPVEEILERVASADKVSKPIVCNQDSKTGEEGARALEAAVNALSSWGYSNSARNQRYPFRFEGAADDPPVYAKFRELATPEK